MGAHRRNGLSHGKLGNEWDCEREDLLDAGGNCGTDNGILN